MSSGQEQRSMDTRERILEVAAKLFVERGFEATSVRDIAAAIGISNPSLYHHFASKGALLEELLAEPLARSQLAIEEASELSGPARTRRLITGLLEALEVHNGIAATAMQQAGSIEIGEGLVAGTRPMIYGLLLPEVADDDADVRVRMMVGAVERVVIELMLGAMSSEDFVTQLRARRETIVDLAMRLVD